MRFSGLHSILAGLVTLMFSALLVAPCFCSTASAEESGDSDDEGCCPSQVAPDSNSGEEPEDEEGCCCTMLSTCGQSEGGALSVSGGAVVSTFDDELSLQGPTTWWTPDLVATLWVVDRLSIAFDSAPSWSEVPPYIVRPDRSQSYLTHSVLLI